MLAIGVGALVVVTLGGSALMVYPSGHPAGPGADTNGDGVITREEAKAEWQGIPEFRLGRWEITESSVQVRSATRAKGQLEELDPKGDCSYPLGIFREMRDVNFASNVSFTDLAYKNGHFRIATDGRQTGVTHEASGFVSDSEFDLTIKEIDFGGDASTPYEVKAKGRLVSPCLP